MSAPSVMTDIDFLALSEITQKDFLYVYRRNSGLLRRKFKARVKDIAAQSGQTLAGISRYSWAPALKILDNKSEPLLGPETCETFAFFGRRCRESVRARREDRRVAQSTYVDNRGVTF
jgi:hypothetical protein